MGGTIPNVGYSIATEFRLSVQPLWHFALMPLDLSIEAIDAGDLLVILYNRGHV